MHTKGRRVSDAPSVRSLWRGIDVQRVALAVLIALGSLALIYVVAANVVLRTRVLRDAVSEGPDVELDYASAYSVWPGLVHVRGLVLEVQDYNIQFAVLADSAVVDVALSDLLFRRFHADHVTLSGLSFRLRPKVEPAEAHSERVAAFPPIPAFPDPPVHVGAKPPPIEDAEYDLWSVALDDVRAELRELWFMEYRYLGAGRVRRGGFRVQPARAFAVYPASVSLEHGTLSVGDDVVVQRLDLGLEGFVDATDVRQDEGPALAEKMSGRLSLNAHGLNLATLAASGGARVRVTGQADLVAALAVSRGRIEPQGTLELTSDQMSIGSPIGTLAGSLSSKFESQPDGSLEWVTSSPKLTLESSARKRGPEIGSPRLTVVLAADSVAQPPRLREIDLDVPRLVVPSLAWARHWLPGAEAQKIEADGRLEGRAHFTVAPQRGPVARVHLRLSDAELSTPNVRSALTGRVDVEIAPSARAASSAGRVDIELDGVEVERARDQSKPFHAAIRLPDIQVSLDPEPTFAAGVSVYASPADSLLSVALGSPMLEDLAADVFALQRLDAQAQLNVSRRAVRVELSHAKSGSLEGEGYWQRPATGDARGAFLISSKVANVGISLNGSDTETAWFVADDWLASGAHSKASGAAPSRPGQPRRKPEAPPRAPPPVKQPPSSSEPRR